ncbi:MAG: glycosyl hydrolase [Schleiferiaceae bacterium]|nr:glycosyl hydrolase [Schleiferiaceae bacterium]
MYRWLLMALLPMMVSAQDTTGNGPALGSMKWRHLGPALTSGRVADLAVNPQNPNQYYVAAASGGVWKTENRGVTFAPIFDKENSYSIGAVEINPHNPHEIWVGTGENNNQRSVAYGDGLYRSRDGGKSWEHIGLKESEHIGMIAFHPEKPGVMYVAAYGPLWRAGGQRGIYKTTDGGKNWERILSVSEHTGFNEIHLDPRHPETLYATAHQRRRHVWTYVSGGPESALYKSTDGGASWQELKKGLPGGDKGRIGLALAPTNPDRLYAMVEGHGVYRSDDRGAHFQKVNDYNSSGNYYVELVPHPSDVNTLYSLDTYLQVSHDGGESWTGAPRAKRHVDDHALWINPEDPAHMIVGCDGGVYDTYDAGAHWHFKPNLPITQFYRVAVDNSRPFYHVYGGTQDNFSLGGPSQTINDRGIVNSDWYITNTGDGFETQIDPKNPDIVYAQAQYGWLVRYDKVSGESVGLKPTPPADSAAYRWNWDAPLLISPHDHETLYFAANKVFRSRDRGQHWDIISPDLTRERNRHEIPVMGEIQSVDAISYDRSTSIYGNIVALDESPLQEGLLYAGTDDGLLQVSEDGGQTWRQEGSFPGVPKYTYVQQVLASRYDAQTVYVVFNNHKNGDFKPYVLKSTDRGQSWQAISGGLPKRGSVYSLQQDHLDQDLLFVGTEFGVHFSANGGQSWRQLSSGMPTIAVRDLAIQRRENDLVAASFGRGFYVLDDYSVLRQYQEVTEQAAHLFPVDTALVYMEASPNGYGKAGFQGASYYMAPNPPVGAAFDLYLKEVPQSLKAQRQKAEKAARKAGRSITYPSLDSLRAEKQEETSYLLWVIRNEAGTEIRRFTEKPRQGLHRYYWDGRLSERARLNQDKAPLTEAGRANLAPPGDYQVSVYLSHKGEVLPLDLENNTFHLRWLNNNTFRAPDVSGLAQFQDSLESTFRLYEGLSQRFKQLQEWTGKLKATARNTPGVPVTLLNDLRQVEQALPPLARRMYGDKVKEAEHFATAPNLEERLAMARWNSYRTTSAPTAEQQKNHRIVRQSLGEIDQQLTRLRSDLLRFYDILQHNEAPVLPELEAAGS